MSEGLHLDEHYQKWWCFRTRHCTRTLGRTMLRLRLPLLGSLRSARFFYLFSCLSISAVVTFYRALFDEFKHNAMQNSCNSINGNVYLFSSRKRLNRLPSLLLLLRKLKGLGARILQSRASTGLTIKFNEQIKR